MCVHAHPDDESSKGAATMAKYVDAGVEVLVVSLTGGERGDILNPRLKDSPDILRDLAQVRRDEMAAAAAALGVEHVWLGFIDSGLPEGDPKPPLPPGCFALEPVSIPTEALVREIRRFRPHVMTTYDENGGYPHPDHIMCHAVSMAAFEAAGDPDAYEHAGPPWQPLKLYYDVGFSKAKIEALHRYLLSTGADSPYANWGAGWDRPERHITTRIHCANWFPRRDAALLAHATQVDPDGTFFLVPSSVQAQLWPTEDFEVALSFVPIDEGENDLFAGLGGAARADAMATAHGLPLAYDGRKEPIR
ncbi:MAG: mycothiol conjugate amidase Mca [Nostocoides sp.]